jgi:hypothetical protein
MIAIDIFCNEFDVGDDNKDRLHRTYAAASTLARRGKAPPGPLVYLDAALSVLDLIGACARRRQAQEITAQLVIEGERLEQLIAELFQQQEALRVQARAHQRQQLQALRHRIEREGHEFQITQAHFTSLARQVKRVGEAIARLRRDAPPQDKHLLELEETYYRLFDHQLAVAGHLLGG